MIYTISKIGNKKVEEDMRIICKEILEKIKDAESIMLTGSFSRAEGPVKIEKEEIFPYNDYDIQIINKKKISKNEIDELSNEISKKLGYRGIINFYPFNKAEQKIKNNFYIDLKCDTHKSIKKLLPRIRTYELRNNSAILYGEDLRNLIPNYQLNEIPLSEGAKLLLDRMSQMIEYYSIGGKHEKEFLTYIIQQAYAAICTSLLLLNRKYEIGYKKSMEIFKKNYKIDFPELYEKIPDLDKKIEKFINWKINPKKLPNKNVEEEWFMAKNNILEVSKYFFSKFLNKNIETTEELSNAVLNMGEIFYTPYLKKIVIPPFVLLAGVTLPALLNNKYNKRLKELKINQKVSLLSKKSADLVIFSSLIYLIDSIKENNRVDWIKMNSGKKILSEVYPVKGENWEDISLDYANAYIAFFLQKI